MDLAIYSLRIKELFMTDSIFGVSDKALQLCEDRAVLLTSNIVNSSTPHFKARDIDYRKLVKQAGEDSGAIEMTSAGHMKSEQKIDDKQLLYRIPMQSSLDGNTVDSEIERKSFIENALQYQVNLTFVQNKTDQLMKAIKGD
jgi:flagellar basal-body rod protein FlgB